MGKHLLTSKTCSTSTNHLAIIPSLIIIIIIIITIIIVIIKINKFCVIIFQAIDKFTECIASQQQWRQFHHICYWELMWCHAFKLDWLMACRYADKLCKESRWSKVSEHAL